MEITIVKEENRKFFLPLAPEEMWRAADFVLGAIEDGTACGVLAVKEEEDSFSILHLYVAENFRKRGIAEELLETLHSLARETRVDFTRCSYVRQPKLEDVFQKLEKNGFELAEESSPVYSVRLSQLPDKYFAANKPGSSRLIPLSDCTARYWNQLLDEIRVGVENGMPEVALRPMQEYDQQASFLKMNEDVCDGCILMSKENGSYTLEYLCVLGNMAPMDMMAMFQAVFQELKGREMDAEVYINALTETTEKMVNQMTQKQAVRLGDAVTQYYIY